MRSRKSVGLKLLEDESLRNGQQRDDEEKRLREKLKEIEDERNANKK
jgi:hypothetical protein